MSPEQIKALRKELACTARELGEALGVDQKTILDWEAGERFPTKKHVASLTALREKGPSAIPSKKTTGPAPGPWAVLSDPTLWAVVRKLVAHKQLRDDVSRMADGYADPSDD